MFETLNDAIALAEFAHRHQVDKAGFPYVEHPKRVLAAVQAQGAPPYVQIAAVLHDVMEDTPFNYSTLRQLGFSEAAVDLVSILSRKIYGTKIVEDDNDYYANIAENHFARMIKLADIGDNTQAWRLSYLSDETKERLRRKYAKALEALG